MEDRTVTALVWEAGALILATLLALGATAVVATLLALAMATIVSVILTLVAGMTLAGGLSPSGRSDRYEPSSPLLSRRY